MNSYSRSVIGLYSEIRLADAISGKIIDSILDYSKLEASGEAIYSCCISASQSKTRNSCQIRAQRVFGRGVQASPAMLHKIYIDGHLS